MRIFRLEHVSCAIEANHGPLMGPDDCCTPDFGWIGFEPKTIDFPAEFCAVNEEQYPRWWASTPDPADLKAHSADGWAMIAYEVPDMLVRIDNDQIMFYMDHATRLGPVSWDLMSSLDLLSA